MAEKLSQSQIDALLSSMLNGGGNASPQEEVPEKKYRKYDFKSPRKFTKDRLKMLSGIFDSYSRILNTRMNGLLHASCEVEVESVEEQRYYEFANALTDTTVLTVAHLNMEGGEEEDPVLLYVNAPVMVSMMDRMLGGNGNVDDDIGEDYQYTDLDLCVYESLMQDVVSGLGEGWANYIQLDFDFGRVESNPTLVQLIGLEETVVLVDLKLKFSNCEGGISIVLPGTMLTNIFTKINEDNPTRRTTAEDHSDEIMGQLRDSSLEVVAELGRTTLRLRDIYSLNVGDVIDLSQKKDSAVFLRIGGRKWFDGMVGVSEKHLAVKIKQVYQNAERRDIQGNE